MTNAHRTLDDLLAISHVCGYCGALPGRWCVVARGATAGATATWLHADRQWVNQTAHMVGYTGGRVAAYDDIAQQIAHAGVAYWSKLPENPTVEQVVELIHERSTTYHEWQTRAFDEGLAAVPNEWRQP